MTEPNIVYIGDEVEWESRERHPFWVAHAAERNGLWYFAIVDSEWVERRVQARYLTTPDGRPVDGFGGAKIEKPGASGVSGGSWVRVINGVRLSPSYGSDWDALQLALNDACQLYGEWVREPTEADLKRRGLL